jgi:tRNA threonylcarbamoyl adenosine modification protein YeaZ
VRLLAIETACGPASVALLEGSEVVTEEISTDPRGHVEFLMPAIERICDLRTLTGIAVDIGPGGFTGLRAGVTTAKALAQTLGIGIHAVSNLTAFAAVAPQAIWTCVDAGRGRVYARSQGGTTKVYESTDLVAAIGNEPVAGWAPYPALDTCLWVHRDLPRARDIALAARDVPAAEPTTIEPLYLRGEDTEIDWEGRGAVIERPDRVKIAGEK